MKGFTLVEVMISLFILLIGMTGVIKLQATSAVITKLSGDLTFAQNLAQTTLQKQLSRPVNVAAANNKCQFDSGLATTKTVTEKGITYTINCSITKNKAPMLGNKKIGTSYSPAAFVKVKVTWNDLLDDVSNDANEKTNSHAVYSYGIITNK